MMWTPQTFDNLALACALAAVALRLLDQPRASAVLSSLCVAAATAGQWLSRRKRPPIL